MYARRFGTATEPIENITDIEIEAPASPTTKDAISNIHSVPPTTGGKSSESLPTNNLFNDASKSTSDTNEQSALLKLNKEWSERCALLVAACADSAILKKLQEHNPELADLGKIGQELINKEGGISSTIAKKFRTLSSHPNHHLSRQIPQIKNNWLLPRLSLTDTLASTASLVKKLWGNQLNGWKK